jgi:His-Xaa-Ser system protein HxsD
MKVTLQVDTEIYSCLAIEKACYRLSDVLASVIKKVENQYFVEITFTGKEKSEEGIQFTLSRLKNEILDQNLREKIKSETEPTRNLILAYAFSQTGLIANLNTPATNE